VYFLHVIGKQPESPNSTSDYDVKQGSRGDDSDNECTDSKYYYSRTANRLSNDEKRKIISLASIQLDNPVFITVLQTTNVRPRNNSLVRLINNADNFIRPVEDSRVVQHFGLMILDKNEKKFSTSSVTTVRTESAPH
jgi:hypothetical protein